jgi:hypothetical protein
MPFLYIVIKTEEKEDPKVDSILQNDSNVAIQ